jgi:hypothetical protein
VPRPEDSDDAVLAVDPEGPVAAAVVVREHRERHLVPLRRERPGQSPWCLLLVAEVASR